MIRTHRLTRILAIAAIIPLSLCMVFLAPHPTKAIDLNHSLSGDAACNNASDGGNGCESVTSSGDGVTANSIVKGGINTALTILGAVSVIMIVYAGFRFALANGDPKTVSHARNTIVYAAVGLTVAIMSYAVVNWFVEQL